MNIRRAKPADAAAIVAMHREAVFAKGAAHYDQAILNAWSPLPTPERITRLEQDIVDPNLIILVAEFEGDVIGFALAAPAKNELGACYVKSNTIGGVGKKLLAEIEALAFQTAEFLTCDASLNAESFYAANAYKVESRGEHQLRAGGSMACMHMKKLRPRP